MAAHLDRSEVAARREIIRALGDAPLREQARRVAQRYRGYAPAQSIATCAERIGALAA